MEDNQINGQKISKEAYCPNSFFDNGTISIGEFKTLDDAMNFPIKEIWCINRTEDNKFQSYKSQGSRLLIICSWNRSIQDSLKFVVAVIHKDKVGKVYYWDMNDLPLYPEERKNQYEGSLGDDATYTLYQIANNRLNCNTNMNKKLIRLTESDLHRIVKRSVNKVLREGINDITPLSTHIQNNQDADLETLGNIVDDLRKVKEGGALSKWNPTIAARLKKSGLVDTETVQAITQISLLIYRLGNMDFSHKRVYNGETFDDTWNRLQHEQD